MSTHIVGFRPPDDKWRKMKSVWDACVAANIAIPAVVIDYFNGQAPDPAGVTVEIMGGPAVTPMSKYLEAGFDVDIRKLPTDVTIVRFFNSW